MKDSWKRILAVVLSVAMVFSASQMNLLAEEVWGGEDFIIEEEIPDSGFEEAELDSDTEEILIDEFDEIETEISDETDSAGAENEPETAESGELTDGEPESEEVIQDDEIIIEAVETIELKAFDTLAGEGTEDSPYLITSEADLEALSLSGAAAPVLGFFRLETDIVLTAENWTPIGISAASSFIGVFDGAGHTVSGLNIAENNGLSGLFGCNGGVIRNLNVEGNVCGSNNTGLIAGLNAGSLENAEASGSVVSTGEAGLLVGKNTGKIVKCHTSGSVESGNSHGGLVGTNAAAGVITECTSSAEVTGNGNAGGLVGYSEGAVRYSGATGNVIGGSNCTGGLIGHSRNTVTENCYAQGFVTGSGDTGGLIGKISAYQGSVMAVYCYASGIVNSSSGAGLIGSRSAEYNGKTTARFNYFNSANTGNREGIPASPAELKEQSTYSGWDFEHIWTIDGSYPVISLRGEIGGIIEDLGLDGDGSAEHPYVITTERQLTALAMNVLPLTGKTYYELGADIELTTQNWTAIGGNGYGNFEGVFDGKNHTVSGLKISGQSEPYEGLFGYNAGTIKNVNVAGAVEAAGAAGLLAGQNKGVIENCHSAGSVESAGAHGGLVGCLEAGGSVTSCTSAAVVSGNGSEAGGLVGYSEGTVRYSGATGNVSGSKCTGGLIGHSRNNLTENCYAQGSVTGSGDTGGLIGKISAYQGSVTAVYCYASGMVNSNSGAGLIGFRSAEYNGKTTARFNYFNSANTGNREGIPASPAELKEQSTYSGWDFEHIWTIDGSYPVISLRGEIGGIIEDLGLDGDGSAEHPYVITTERQLTALAMNVLPLTGKTYYELGADIDLTAKNWTSIGGNGYGNFEGVFDGKNYTVSGLKISGQSEPYEGLFGYNAGTIKNVNVAGAVEAAGAAGLLAGQNKGVIENCHSAGSVESAGAHGGLVGCLEAGGSVTSCTSAAVVSGNGSEAGGLVGYSEGTVRYSGATGNVSGSKCTGGLIGHSRNNLTENCYAQGSVTGSGDTGGLIGKISAYQGSVTTAYCYASGMVNSNSGAGLIGFRSAEYNGKTIARFNYFNSANTGNREGIPAASSELKEQSTYSGWDFAHIWTVTEGRYPVIELRGEPENVAIEGEGNEDSPFLITNEAQLQAFAQGKYPIGGKNFYALTNDIVLTSSNWTPIGGNGETAFEGIFDGRGHTVSGLRISGRSEADTGLFGVNSGIIRNLNVSGTADAQADTGILVGENLGKIQHCSVSGSVTGTSASGGLAGRNASAGTITQCSSAAAVAGSGTAGGLVGDNAGLISSSFASGNVILGSGDAGGLTGASSGTIADSYAKGNVKGSTAGGFAGYNNRGTITNCFSVGKANEGNGGGLVGRSSSGTVTNSYYCSDTSFCTATSGGESRTRAEMRRADTYIDWDFGKMWGIYETVNNGFPFLLCELEYTAPEERSFWYEAEEHRKGYAAVSRNMKILLKAEESSSVIFTVLYSENDEVKKTELPAVYEKEREAFAAEFTIAEGIWAIQNLTARVTDAEGTETKIDFVHSFMYQMPLNVEGLLEVKLPKEAADSRGMSLKLKNASGSTFYAADMNGEEQLVINGLPGGTYRAELQADGEVYAVKENITVVQGKTETVDFTDIPRIANVEVEFYADGKKLSAGGLAVNFFDRTEGKARVFSPGTSLSFLNEGDTIGYSLVLGREAQRQYRNDTAVYEKTLSAGLNLIRIDLSAFHTTDVSLKIKSSTSGQPVGFVNISASQTMNGIHSYQSYGTSDKAGACALQMIDEEAVITISKKGYTTKRETFTFEQLQNGVELEIEPLKGMVEFNISYQECRYITDEETDTYVLRPKQIYLVREKTGVRTPLDLKDWPIVYTNGNWDSNETFTAEVQASGYENLEISAQVNAVGNLYFSGTMIQKGAVMLSLDWEQGLSSDFHTLSVFNGAGDRLRTKETKDAQFLFEKLPAGNYTVAAADSRLGMENYEELSELRADEMMEGYYAEGVVTVEDGFISELDLTIPSLPESRRLIKAEESSVTSNVQYARIGDNIHIRAHYEFNSIGVKYKELQVSVPEGTRLVEDSVTVNGKQSPVSVQDGTFKASVDGSQATVRYTVRVLSTVEVSELVFAGRVAYEFREKQCSELLGKANVRLNELTVVAPPQTNYSSLSVHGVCPSYTPIEIYDDDVLVGQTYSNKYGAYRADIELTARGRNVTHHLRAVCMEDGVQKESETVNVHYGSNTAMLLQFDIRCNAHDNTVYTVKDPTRGIGNITFTYNPAYPVTFIARFDDNAGVTLVTTVIGLTNGNEIEVGMTYNEGYDYWEGTVKMDSRDIPNSFNVEFMPVKFALPEDKPLEIGFAEGAEIVSTVEEESIISQESRMHLEDANRTEVMVLTQIEKNVSFTPSDEYVSADIEGSMIYYKKITESGSPMTVIEKNGTLYEVYQYYMQMEDGTYVLCTKGIGFEGSASAAGRLRIDYGQIKDAHSAYEYVKELNSYGDMENDGCYTSSENDFVNQMIEEMKKSDDPYIRNKATQYEAMNSMTKLAESMNWAFDSCKEVIDKSDADNGIYDKIWEQVTKKAKKSTDAMKDASKMTYGQWINYAYGDMFNDPEVVKFIEENGSWSMKQKLKKYRKMYPAANAKTIVDPSGYVYETFEENRLEGVTAELYFENDRKDMEFWDAEEYSQVNPQKTDSEGKYGWDVPEGTWQVVYSKDGYEKTQSAKLIVPPPQLDVNIEMVAKGGASIAQLSCSYNRLTLVFDKYLQKASVAAGRFAIVKDGVPYDVKTEIREDNVRLYKGTEVVKSIDLVLKSGSFEDGTYEVTAEKGLLTYAGTAGKAMESRFISASGADETSYKVTIPDKVVVMRGDEQLASGDTVYRNDRLQITAKPAENETVRNMTVNGEAFVSGEYYTVTDESLVVGVSFTEMLQTYRVSFDSTGGSAVASLEDVPEGTKIRRPADPKKKYSRFEGWYTTAECTVPWEFEKDTVNENIVLYAKWNDADYSVTLDQAEASLYVGEELALTAEVATEEQEVPQLMWKSSDTSVAVVSQQGAVTAVGSGEAEIQVVLEGRTSAAAVCRLTVTKRDQVIRVTDVITRKLSDGNFDLGAKLETGDGNLTYASENESVASVTKIGRVIVKSVGKVQLQIMAEETGEYAAAVKTVTLTVEPPEQIPDPEPEDPKPEEPKPEEPKPEEPQPPIECTKHEYKKQVLLPASCEQIGVVIYTCIRKDDSYGEILPKLGHSWSGWKVVKKADALQEGMEERTCSRCNEKETRTIDKLNPILETNVSSVTLKVKQSTTALKVTKMQEGDRIASWKSSNKKIVTVSSKGKLTAKKTGKAVVTVTLESGISRDIKVKVQKTAVAATKVILSQKSMTLKKGSSAKLGVELEPITCVIKPKFKTSKKSVATVSSKGVIKARKKGMAKITVQVGKKKAVCTVTVQ